ncbi:MAG: hypothetical protein KDA63_14975 [Planctomycetales bacterium]|nr:hypothetical protein [Planctomycetales bacterium]
MTSATHRFPSGRRASKYSVTPRRAPNGFGFPRRLLQAALVATLGLGSAVAWGDTWPVRVIREVPLTTEAIAAAHAQSKNACHQVAVGDPMQIADFAGEAVYTVPVKKDGKVTSVKLPFRYSRLGVLTFGMQLQPSDQARLPAVSKSEILDRIASNYISIQVRVQRDAETGAVYLHYQPFAAVGMYQNPGKTDEFQPLMEDSVRDVRSLGLFFPDGSKPSAEAFRTLVAVSKSTVAVDGSSPDDPDPATETEYELIFVRARIDGDDVQLHSFTTGNDRTVLRYLPPYVDPATADDCNVTSTIFFTEYTAAKQSPSAKVNRSTVVNSQANFTMEQLNAFAAEQGWQGDAMANLTATLDAIIDGKIKPATVE